MLSVVAADHMGLFTFASDVLFAGIGFTIEVGRSTIVVGFFGMVGNACVHVCPCVFI